MQKINFKASRNRPYGQVSSLHKVLLLLLFTSIYHLSYAQTIPSNFFSQNAWMPDTIGSTPYYGELHSSWNNVKQSKAKLMRYGGIASDFEVPSTYQYLRIVDSIRAKGMEPILQLSYGNGDINIDTTATLPIFRYINITMNRKVKYWSIGNEPDNEYSANNKTAAAICAYIKRYALAMKKIDSSIRIIAPDFAYLAVYTNSVADSLTTPGGASNIVGLIPAGNGIASGKPYVDYFSYHMYHYNGYTTTMPRSWLISKLTGPSGDSVNMAWLKQRLDYCNTNVPRTSQPIKPMMTEANICYYSNPGTVANDNWQGVKGNSFFAGQHWCQIMALAVKSGFENVNFWSVMEGSGLGYMTNSTTPTKKSTYWHFKEMAEWFNGEIYIGADNHTNIKAFGSKNGNYIAVMVLNQDTITTAAKPYTIYLNSSTGGTTWISMNMGISKTYVDTIDASSSTLLVFDLYGNISQKYYYKQSDGSSQPGFHQRYSSCGLTKTYASQGALDAYAPAQYQHIVLGDAAGTNSVTVDSGSPNYNNSIYRATTSITLEKNFSSGIVGQTLDLIIDSDCQ